MVVVESEARGSSQPAKSSGASGRRRKGGRRLITALYGARWLAGSANATPATCGDDDSSRICHKHSGGSNSHLERVVSLFRSIVSRRTDWILSSLLFHSLFFSFIFCFIFSPFCTHVRTHAGRPRLLKLTDRRLPRVLARRHQLHLRS